VTTVLIAEDVDDLAMVYRRICTRAGLTVVRGADGVEALELAVEHRPDVVLTDLGMPRLDGWGLIAEIRGLAEIRDTPVAIITGQLQPGDGRVAESGACAVLHKPCRNDELVDVVRGLAERGPHGHGGAAGACPARVGAPGA
jgi:CheY-like chemotaxis protein